MPLQVIQYKLATLVDAMKVEAGDVAVVVVGGGAPLCTTDISQLPGKLLVISHGFSWSGLALCLC